MTFGLDDSLVRELARGVRDAGITRDPPMAADAHDGDADDGEAAEIFARAAWSNVAEPGDNMAGLVVGCLGAVEALTLLVETRAADLIAGMIRDREGTGADEPDTDLTESVASALERWRPRVKSADVINALRQARLVGARLLLAGDELWPERVGDLETHAPLVLWWRGRPDALRAWHRSVALVGARAASGYGEHVAMEASAGLVDRGFSIVSGAAYGIDGMAHRAALSSHGTTVAFLAGGVDRFYPSGHDALLTRITETGAVVSELPCGAAPTKWRFLQRNRLIAASAAATIVLEAGWRSGSLNTAGHAAALGRPLGAVPGPVTSPTSAGCHRLIREYGAVCVTNAAEMAELAAGADDTGTPEGLGSGPADYTSHPHDDRTSDQVRVLDALSARSPRSAADIASRAGMSTIAVLGALGSLALESAAVERERGWVRGTNPHSR